MNLEERSKIQILKEKIIFLDIILKDKSYIEQRTSKEMHYLCDVMLDYQMKFKKLTGRYYGGMEFKR